MQGDPVEARWVRQSLRTAEFSHESPPPAWLVRLHDVAMNSACL